MQFAAASDVEQHQVRARLADPQAPLDSIAAARSAVMNGGLIVEPRCLSLDASPSVALSLGKLTLRRPAPPVAAANPGALLWKFRTTEPGVYAVRPAMGMIVNGRAMNDDQTVTVTRRAVSSGRRANVESRSAPRLKLSSVVLGPGHFRCGANSATHASTATEVSALWETVANTPVLKASAVHQYVEIQLTTPASLARDRGTAAIRSTAPVDGVHGSSTGSRVASGSGPEVACCSQAIGSPACVQQSASEWAAEVHQKATSMQAVPEYFLDPILGRIFMDPVTTEVGNTYERASIERWLASGKRTDPLTNAVLEDTRLVPNNLLRSQIQAWRAAAQNASPPRSVPRQAAVSCGSSKTSSSRNYSQQVVDKAADTPEQRTTGALQQQQRRRRQQQEEETTPSESDLSNHSSVVCSISDAARKDNTYAAKRLVLSECNENAPA